MHIRRIFRAISFGTRSWTAEELNKLHKSVSEARQGSGAIDWASIQQRHFPDSDPLELSYQFEFHARDAGTLIATSTPQPPKREVSVDLDRKILDAFRNQPKAFRYTLSERVAIMKGIGGDLSQWDACVKRYKELKDGKLGRVEKLKALDLYEKGASIPDIIGALNRQGSVTVDEVVRAVEGGTQNGPKRRSFHVIARQQYKVMGPEWKALARILDAPEPQIALSIKTAPPIWSKLEGSVMDESEKLTGSGLWSTHEKSRLMELVLQNGTDTIGWRSISDQMGRSVTSCKIKYRQLTSGLTREGRFSHEEDLMLAKAWKKHGSRFLSHPEDLPKRTDMSLTRRLFVLRTENTKKAGRGYRVFTEVE